jgi:thiamine-monophosphate kinase
LTRASEISIHTTAIGKAARPLRRDAAQVGDEIWLVGVSGAAAAGLSVLMTVRESKWDAAMRACVNAWRHPQARLREGIELVGRANSAIDVSDGLASDASHIAEASGVALIVHARALERVIPLRVRSVGSSLGCSALNWSLTGGEDYALLATGPSTRRPRFARAIGVVERGRGVWLEADQGRRPIEGGFDHFA